MSKLIKQRLSVLLIVLCSFLFATACSGSPAALHSNEHADNSVQAYHVTFEDSGLNTYIDVYQTKLFYMKIDGTLADFYVYDFQSQKTHKVLTVSDFALKGKSNEMIKDTLYFYITIYQGDNLENVLYAMNFSTEQMHPVSENTYAQKLIPLAELDNQLLALQGDVSNAGTASTFIEKFNPGGDPETVAIKSGAGSSHQILFFDNDQTYLYTIEREISGSDTNYYLAKYDSDFSLMKEVNITDMFQQNPITVNIGSFYAFDDYFCLTDFSSQTLIGKIKKDGIQVLLCDNGIEYVNNETEELPDEYFYKRNTNDLYKLDTATGDMQVQNYKLNNDSSTIRCVLSYDDSLLIVKNTIPQDNQKEAQENNVYLLPGS